MHLIDEMPASLVAGVVEQLSAEKNVDAKQIWKNLAKVAAEILSPNEFWSSVG